MEPSAPRFNHNVSSSSTRRSTRGGLGISPTSPPAIADADGRAAWNSPRNKGAGHRGTPLRELKVSNIWHSNLGARVYKEFHQERCCQKTEDRSAGSLERGEHPHRRQDARCRRVAAASCRGLCIRRRALSSRNGAPSRPSGNFRLRRFVRCPKLQALQVTFFSHPCRTPFVRRRSVAASGT
jgi:hypothetical protein